jgi:hypothetical protein
MYARYNTWDESSPFLFRAAGECGVYKLQNKYSGLNALDPNDDHWVGLENCGQWLRSIHSLDDGTPFRFIKQADGTYKMKNEVSGPGIEPFVAYTDHPIYECGEAQAYPTYALRADYSEASAMKVHLHWESTAAASCHPWDGQRAKMLVTGYDGGSLNKKVSFSNDLWLFARYNTWDESSPFLFRAAGECGVYKLQNKYSGLNALDPNDDHWVGLENCGQWLRSIHSLDDGTPFRFIEQADGTYKMNNEVSGPGIQPFVAYTDHPIYECGEAQAYSANALRAVYSEASAMKVSLHWE